MCKRLLSLGLLCAFIVSIFPAPVFAEDLVTIYSQPDDSGEMTSTQPLFQAAEIESESLGNLYLGKGRLQLTFTMKDPNAAHALPGTIYLESCKGCRNLQRFDFTQADRDLLKDGEFHTFTVQTGTTTIGLADGTSPVYVLFSGLTQIPGSTRLKSNSAGTIPAITIRSEPIPPIVIPEIPATAEMIYEQNDDSSVMTNPQQTFLGASIESESLGNLNLGQGKLLLRFTLKSPHAANIGSNLPERVTLGSCKGCRDLQIYRFTNADRELLADEAFHTFVVETGTTTSSYADGTNPVYFMFDNLPQFQFSNQAKSNAERTIPTLKIAKAPSSPAVCSECASNVLFLPGIEASRLYRPDGSGEKKLWEPSRNDTLHDLYLSEEGVSLRGDVYTKVNGIIDEIPITGANIYKSFIARMNTLREDGVINDWTAGAYDWRLSLDDILSQGKQIGSHISYVDATTTPYLIQELRRLASTSKTGKVTIIAHSNGGLVAKRLTNILGSDASALIDTMIFVAVPQSGTPAAVAAGLHGYDQKMGAGPVTFVSQQTARTFASTTPMLYHLLPSARYFTQVDDPIITFDSSLSDWVTRYGSVIHSAENLHTFLTDSFGRVDSQTGDIDQPIQLLNSMVSSSESLHDDLDTWTAPNGIELIQIAGWGIPTTVSGLTYTKKNAGVKPEPTFTIDGDGTVVTPSALWTTDTAEVKNYWLDLQRYNKDNRIAAGFGLASFNHSRILEPGQMIDFIFDHIQGTVRNISEYLYLSDEAPPSTGSRLRYTLRSPLTLSLYDNQGRHTGVSTTTGLVEEQIPGTYYTEFGDVKYIFADPIASSRIIMDGYDTGTFTFQIDQYDGNAHTAGITFKDIPTSANTMVGLTVDGDITTVSNMLIDEDGDGATDTSITPRLNGEVTYPDRYHFRGFLRPISDPRVTGNHSPSVFKGGSTIPVKFQLLSSLGVPVQSVTAPEWIVPLKSKELSVTAEPVVSNSDTTGNVYVWDEVEKQYVYNWDTKGLAVGYWYTIYARLDDGKTYSISIGLR
jgi:hypothetical protein